MIYGIQTLDDFDYQGKTVLCRVDINEPVDRQSGKLRDTTRIAACIPTLEELSSRGAKLVVLAHQGSDIEYKNYYSTSPHAEVLSGMMNREIKWIDDVCGPAARQMISSLSNGEILLLDNVRHVAEEQTLFEIKLQLSPEQQSETLLVKKLSPLADYYVCDAFAAAHRSQPSLCGFEELLPSAMGRLFEKEYRVISDLLNHPDHPCVFMLGGSKISDAFLMMDTILKNKTADLVLTGGLVGNILLYGSGHEIGSGSLDFIYKSNYQQFIETAKVLTKKYPDQIIKPEDLAYVQNGMRVECPVSSVPSDIKAVDIGSRTIQRYKKLLRTARTVFANGPMGVFENPLSEEGTKEIFLTLADLDAYTVVGGGDSITAAAKYRVTDSLDYVCTGGGSLVQFLSGKELPVVSALRHSAIKFQSRE